MTESGRKCRAVSRSRPRCLNRGWSHTEVAFTIHMLAARCLWCLHGSFMSGAEDPVQHDCV